MGFKIVTLPGDGIGPDVVQCAVDVLEVTAKLYGFEVSFESADIGGIAIDRHGNPLPEETVEKCKAADAVLLGAVGGPKWESLPAALLPEKGLLGIRSALGLFANLRPARVFPQLAAASPLKPELVENIDVLFVRELTGDVYFGPRQEAKFGMAYDTMLYTAPEVERVARRAFELARLRGGHVTSVDKANVLASSRLWRSEVIRVAAEYPDVKLDHLYVDNASMQLVINPGQFDVVVTGNLFGDILSDEASMITGSIGMLASASLGEGTLGLYEPIHGSAPTLAGRDIANPLATILSAAMLLRHSLSQELAAKAVEDAVQQVLSDGWRTADIARPGEAAIGTALMGRLVCKALEHSLRHG